jgi:hypothetical protein
VKSEPILLRNLISNTFWKRNKEDRPPLSCTFPKYLDNGMEYQISAPYLIRIRAKRYDAIKDTISSLLELLHEGYKRIQSAAALNFVEMAAYGEL